MLNEIKEKYNHYIGIYSEILPKIDNETAKRFLENSLYLSIFTSFEYFLKKIIEHYVEEKIRLGMVYLDLHEGFARRYILDREKEIGNIFKANEINSRAAFSRYFNKLKKPLPKDELVKYIHFEFLHESKLNSYYEMLFEQILGNGNILKDTKISSRVNSDSEVDQQMESDAYTFLLNYCSNIRNNIAHSNDSFKVPQFPLFELPDFIKCFIEIMEAIKESYERHNTGFNLSIVLEQNVLDLT